MSGGYCKQPTETFIIVGPIVHSTDIKNITIIENGMIAIQQGKIIALGEKENLDVWKEKLHLGDCDVITLAHGMFLMPGLIDTHIHAPQYPNMGIGYDRPLLEWLNTYTFPMEKRFSDVNFAREVYTAVVKRSLFSGTTTASYFGTIHVPACEELVKAVARSNQRAFVGKVCMDMMSPDDYVESTQDSVQMTEEFISSVLTMKLPLIQPIVTPRFAVSCTMPLLSQLATVAKKYDIPIQSHVSENKNEVELVLSLFPECRNYTSIYDRAGLLSSKTILAHGVWLSDEELPLLTQSGTTIAHCPSSNMLLKSGLCDVRRLLDKGVQVALGTDVSGGMSVSVLDAIRSGLAMSRCISFANNCEPLSHHELFYLATMGGAKALGLEKITGNFEEGKDFDALVTDMNSYTVPGGFLFDGKIENLLSKFLYSGDDRNIKQVYVAGKEVKESVL